MTNSTESTPPQPPSPVEPKSELAVSAWGRLVYAVMALAVLFLAVTGVGTFISGHAPMTHWVLMAHVAMAPVFAIGLALVALTWSDRCRFGCTLSRQRLRARLLLWLILLCGLVVILSGVVPMLSLFGTDGQHLLYLTHRYAGITMAVLVMLHFAVRKSNR